MKKIFLIIIILCLYNCGVHKIKINEQIKIQRLIDSLDFKVVLPENWKSILDSHQNLSYSPIDLDDKFYKNIVRIDDISDGNEILKSFVIKSLKAEKKDINNEPDKLNSIKTKYGETYVIREESDWNFTHYIKTTFYFRHNDKIFRFHYSSDERFQKKYFHDIDFIFNSLEFN